MDDQGRTKCCVVFLALALVSSPGELYTKSARGGGGGRLPLLQRAAMISSPRTTIDLTMEDDDPRQPKRIKTDVGSVPSPQPYAASVSTFPAHSYSYSASPPSSTPYQTPATPWTATPTPAYDPNRPQSPYPAAPQPYRTYSSPAAAQSPTTHQNVFPVGQYGAASGPIYTPQQAAQYAPSNGSPYRPLPPRQVIDLTGPQGQSPYTTQLPTQQQIQSVQQAGAGANAVGQPKDGRRDVVCIGQLSATALILYPVNYICPQPGQAAPPLPATSDDYVPVRLKYDDASKRRLRNPGQPGEETIQIMVPHYKGGLTGNEPLGGEEFGVVEQRIATVLGPLMQKVLIRLEAHVRRATTSTAPILPLRILVFTPRGNVKVVASYLQTGALGLEHPSLPYNPSDHRDSPPYENPHQAVGGSSQDYRYPSAVQNRWTSQAISGKSVEVQRSQVDEVFKSLRSGDDLTETEAGEYFSRK